MFKDIEKVLKDSKSSYEDVKIPENINEYILNGIERGRRNKRKTMMRRISSLVATVFLIVFLISLRFSPSFASYISEIPGLEYLVKLVNYDRGLELALRNQFVQGIGVSDEHDNIKFTVDSIIVDESRMIIFYSLDKGERLIQFSRVELLDNGGGRIPVAYSLPGYDDEDNNQKILRGKIDVSFSEEDIPEEIIMKVRLKEYDKVLEEREVQVGMEAVNVENINDLPYTWEVRIPIDKDRFKGMEEIYTINQEIEIEGQRIIFEGLTIYPTRIALDVKFHEDNSMKIFTLEDLKIADEKGEWLTITNGVTATHFDENTKRLYFQSNYFTNPKKIYIEGSKIRALDKEKLDIVVDLEGERLIKSPDDKIKFKGVSRANEGLKLDFAIKNNEDNSHFFEIFDRSFNDALGREFNFLGITEFYPGEGEYNQNIGYYIPGDLEIQNPITLKLVDYPNRLEKPFKVKVK